MSNRIHQRNKQFNRKLTDAFNKFLAHQAKNLESVAYQNHEMIIAMGMSNIVIGVAVCVLTGEVTVLYIVASIVANTLIDLGVSMLSSLLMRTISENFKGKEVKYGQDADFQVVPA